jgi:hypothetical protein
VIDGLSFTVQKAIPGDDHALEALNYMGCSVTGLEFEAKAKDVCTLHWTVVAQFETTGG